VLDGDPSSPTERAQQPSLTFRPMSIVAKRSPISATAELVLGLKLEIALKQTDGAVGVQTRTR